MALVMVMVEDGAAVMLAAAVVPTAAAETVGAMTVVPRGMREVTVEWTGQFLTEGGQLVTTTSVVL